ncbi:ATP-binding protein [Actinomadura parmotrematis]|uniref:ATP-binding protein n=1 Tax=Actinomadura parmotrematis TaxID=2864039 RepID=A0ABS7FT84_9ACTN|nr:ATP-binding protein [Actinomadura parmotrematis]MBW8483621.1 ATP-binding protein [Actinomadura parmotrematis]
MAISDTATRIEVLRVPGVERAVGHVRRWLRDVAGPGHPALDDCTLCASELVTNALRYSASGLDGGQVLVELGLTGPRLRLEVLDDGGGVTVPRAADRGEEAVRGRGLRIVAGCADAWGVRRDGDRYAVWAVLGG